MCVCVCVSVCRCVFACVLCVYTCTCTCTCIYNIGIILLNQHCNAMCIYRYMYMYITKYTEYIIGMAMVSPHYNCTLSVSVSICSPSEIQKIYILGVLNFIFYTCIVLTTNLKCTHAHVL